MRGLTIAGLGPGHPELVTLEVRAALDGAGEVWARTARHPALYGRKVRSFDHLYRRGERFEDVYQAIAGELRRRVQRRDGLLYAVPGHPLVGERTTQLLLQDPGARILPGLSFADACLPLLGVEALQGLQLLDAMELGRQLYPHLEPNQPALVAQLWSREVASDLKLTLFQAYPPEHPVRMVLDAGTEQARVVELALAEVDRREWGDAAALYLPPLSRAAGLPAFQEVVATLRAPQGCPWDREQTHASLRPFLLSEAYEALDALDREDYSALAEELGDLLFQIGIHVQLQLEEDGFGWPEVIGSIVEKLVRRHPHVFGEAEVRDSAEVLERWGHLKARERPPEQSLLSGIPSSQPALAWAQAVEERVAQAGFDWPEVGGVWAKLEEELGELRAAGTPEERAAELGDVLFVLANLARWLKLDAEGALRDAVRRFSARYARMERRAAERGRPLAELSLEEQNALWAET